MGDTRLDVKLEQNVGLLQILSLNLRQSDAYINRSSNYGVIVGRVLANDGLGIENAKLSVFIPITEDYFVKRIRSIYPYRNINKRNGINGKRYNLLEDFVDDECHTDIGSFPSKRMVLDETTYIEVFDKYYKYTTTTNQSGDYMIYGVPVGNQQLHLDIDLSNIGILSQRPRDMMYQGYGKDLFENPNKFKTSSNLDSLAQVITRNQTVEVLPFWGDESQDNISITRADINVDYKFEPTCVFLGSVITDEGSNSVGSTCIPARYVGKEKMLIAGEGTIEMIRKTQDGYVEEFNIGGGRVIDSNGVWCYQIPMNLDYIVTDEEGNIVPSEDPSKGIATRARVRFRITLDDMDEDGKSRHRAKYLIPNNPRFDDVSVSTTGATTDHSYTGDINKHYEFGSATMEEDFRDLQWNKVYTVKSFIPRIVNGASKKHWLPSLRENKRAFLGMKSLNNSDRNNPMPFNNFMGSLSFAYRFICVLFTFYLTILGAINNILSLLSDMGFSNKFFSWHPFKNTFKCLYVQLDDYTLLPRCDNSSNAFKKTKREDGIVCKGDKCRTTVSDSEQVMQEKLADEFDAIDLDFSNDWINGTLYFPMWHWLKKKKKTFFFGLFKKRAVDRFCNCDKGSKNAIAYHYSHIYKSNMSSVFDNSQRNMPKVYLNHGIVKQYYNRDNVDIYYYAPAVVDVVGGRNGGAKQTMYRLFATDLVMIGSLSSKDMDGVGMLFRNLPQSTAKVPPLIAEFEEDEDNTSIDYKNGQTFKYQTMITSGMDERHGRKDDGLFFGISCNDFYPLPQGIINAQRVCELGVELDTAHYYPIKQESTLTYGFSPVDFKISKTELYNADIRAEFATYNQNPLICNKLNKQTGYYTYDYEYKYPLNFDGAFSGVRGAGIEKSNRSYIDFRMGKTKRFYQTAGNGYEAPIYENSFYFYFGLKEGATAIDKFRSDYYVDCIKNDELGFPIYVDIQRTPRTCIKSEDDYAIFSIDMSNAAKPYEMYIKNADGDEVLRIQNCTEDKIQLQGTFDYFGDLGEMKGDHGSFIFADIYKVFVRDTMDKTSYSKIDLDVSSIEVNAKVTNFKKKIDQSPSADEYGHFTIGSMIVDSENVNDIVITDITNSFDIEGSMQPEDYESLPKADKRWAIDINGDVYIVGYKQNPSSTRQSDSNLLPPELINFRDGEWWVGEPSNINLTIVKLCYDEVDYIPLVDFQGTIFAEVKDFDTLKLTLNGFAVPEWVGMKEESGVNVLSAGTNLYNPTSYEMNDRGLSYPYWADVVNGYNDLLTDQDKNLAIVSYKLGSLFTMSNITFRADDGLPIAVGYDWNSKPDEETVKGYAMYPTLVESSEFLVNTHTGYTMEETDSFLIDGRSPQYTHSGYCYGVAADYTFEYWDSSTPNEYPIYYSVNATALEHANKNAGYHKNTVFNGNSQTFGFNNCAVISNSGNASPTGSKYTEMSLSGIEIKQPHWLSFDTYDKNFDSQILAVKGPEGVQFSGCIHGGLFFDTTKMSDTGAHNIISNDGSTTYSYNLDDASISFNSQHESSLYSQCIYEYESDENTYIKFPTVKVSNMSDIQSTTLNMTSPKQFQSDKFTVDIKNNSYNIDLYTNFESIDNDSELETKLIGEVSYGQEFKRTVSISDNSISIWAPEISSLENVNFSNFNVDHNAAVSKQIVEVICNEATSHNLYAFKTDKSVIGDFGNGDIRQVISLNKSNIKQKNLFMTDGIIIRNTNLTLDAQGDMDNITNHILDISNQRCLLEMEGNFTGDINLLVVRDYYNQDWAASRHLSDLWYMEIVKVTLPECPVASLRKDSYKHQASPVSFNVYYDSVKAKDGWDIYYMSSQGTLEEYPSDRYIDGYASLFAIYDDTAAKTIEAQSQKVPCSSFNQWYFRNKSTDKMISVRLTNY